MKGTPQKIMDLAHKYGFDTAEFYGTKDGVDYFILGRDEGDPPAPTGYPQFLQIKDKTIIMIDGRVVFDLFRRDDDLIL